ncbi:DUF2884 family protein [Luteimonas sp BLCC-B24]|uniref:DUF2884 family protein n=1 Tax=Luteimonas sp. BLCC-B24 TaxID=3025317 RepID=UPI00234D249B|nr:DUF2884 family protein [Luteimonas sp. BLCC-B24]MDC7808153.1 DUF2884 family protein [Luteimonas sp. BLCC-B24]
MTRRRSPRLVVLLALVLVAGLAHASGDEAAAPLSADRCAVSTPYNVLVDTGGVWLYRGQGRPQEIFFHDGTLSVDRTVQTVSTADAQRLRQLESGARALMPDVAEVARQSAGLAFEALAGVVEAMTGSARQVRQVERFHADTTAHIDRTLGRGRWDQDVFGPGFEARIEAVAERMNGSLGRSVMWQVITGRAARMDARAERLDAELTRRIDARSAELERRVDALCAQVQALHALQAALEYRFEGERLVMLAPAAEGANARSGASAADAPHD